MNLFCDSTDCFRQSRAVSFWRNRSIHFHHYNASEWLWTWTSIRLSNLFPSDHQFLRLIIKPDQCNGLRIQKQRLTVLFISVRLDYSLDLNLLLLQTLVSYHLEWWKIVFDTWFLFFLLIYFDCPFVNRCHRRFLPKMLLLLCWIQSWCAVLIHIFEGELPCCHFQGLTLSRCSIFDLAISRLPHFDARCCHRSAVKLSIHHGTCTECGY